jgi:hypothetical protein
VIAKMHFNHADISGVGSFDVAENTSDDLQDLIDRLRGGDIEARRELLQRAYNRLLRIAAAVFHEDFPTCATVMTWKASSAKPGCGWSVPWRRLGCKRLKTFSASTSTGSR